MYFSKHFIHILNQRRGIHLSVDSSGLENSCWQIRKGACRTNMTDPHSIDQRSNNTWFKQLADDNRMDRLHYNPMPLKDRTYDRTWNEYEIQNRKAHKRIKTKHTENTSRERDIGSYSLEGSDY